MTTQTNPPAHKVVQPGTLEPLARVIEQRHGEGSVDRGTGDQLTVRGPNGTGYVRPGSPWAAVWSMLKMIGLLLLIGIAIYVIVIGLGPVPGIS